MRSGAKLIHKSSNNSGTLYQIENYVGLRIESNGPQLYRCGNAVAGCTSHARCNRFNGAATLSLRKFAKMGILKSVVHMLQWGRNFIVAEILQIASLGCSIMHSFNGAAILSLRKCLTPITLLATVGGLQWGRNFIVAEIVLLAVGFRIVMLASMGPQLYRCGNRQCAGSPWSRLDASMGPQLYRCGNGYRYRGYVVYDALASMGPQLYRCGNYKCVCGCMLQIT